MRCAATLISFPLAILPLAIAGIVPVRAAGLTAPELNARVSLRLTGTPLAEVVRKLGESAPGARLEVAPELREAKATVILGNESLGNAMARLAQVFGAEWRRAEGAKDGKGAEGKNAPGWEMRREKAVSDWLKLWGRTFLAGERFARTRQEEFVRGDLARRLAELDAPPQAGNASSPPRSETVAAGRLISSLVPALRERLVQHLVARSPVRAGGGSAALPPPIVVSFTELSPLQQGLVRDLAAFYPDRSGNHLQRSQVEIGSRDGLGVNVIIHPPPPEYRYGGTLDGAQLGPELMESLRQQEQLRRLARGGTPEGALLGAAVLREGTIQPALRFEDPQLGDRSLESRPERPLAFEFLIGVADRLGLNLVADYHTRSTRLPAPAAAPTVRQALEGAAAQFQLILRQQGSYLLARNRCWPDRDEEETPAPYPEDWIAAKTRGVGLSLDDLTILGRLSDARLDGLSAYRDGSAQFRLETNLIRRSRWVWPFIDSLSSEERRAAESPEGLPFRRLDLRKRTYVIQSLRAQAPWAEVHLYLTTWDRSVGKGAGSFQEARLAVPGSSTPIWSALLQPPFGPPPRRPAAAQPSSRSGPR